MALTIIGRCVILKAAGYVHLEMFLFYHLYRFDDFENYDYGAYEKSDSLNA